MLVIIYVNENIIPPEMNKSANFLESLFIEIIFVRLITAINNNETMINYALNISYIAVD